MSRFIGALVLILFAGSPALAASWTVQPAQSQLSFAGVQTGTPFKGSFSHWTAAISFDPGKPQSGHVELTIAMASAKTGDLQRDTAMPQADWFNASVFPEAHFEATGFVPKGGANYQTTGMLTIRGNSHKVTLPFTLLITGSQALGQGKITLQCDDFGVGQGSWSSGDWVGLNVAVNFTIVASKAP